MNQEKFGKLIKQIRKENNLTQKNLADRYNVTYQAVSKWENGLNMPDISILKQISKDFNIPMDSLMAGEYKEEKSKKAKSNDKESKSVEKSNKGFIISVIILILIIILLIILIINKNDNFEAKKISSNCNDFNITGTISYNDTKSAIYISKVEYCGVENTEVYNSIDCYLYEKNNNLESIISTCSYENNENVTLDEYLNKVSISTDNYSKICKEYKDNLFLLINATNKNNLITTYKIPLTLNDYCEVE